MARVSPRDRDLYMKAEISLRVMVTPVTSTGWPSTSLNLLAERVAFPSNMLAMVPRSPCSRAET